MKSKKTFLKMFIVIVLSVLISFVVTSYLLNKNIKMTTNPKTQDEPKIQSVFREPTKDEQKEIEKKVNRRIINAPNPLEKKEEGSGIVEFK